MRVGLVVYGSLEEISGGFRYDRKLVEHLREAGDTVEVIALPWPGDDDRSTAAASPAGRSRLERPVDVLLQDELCHPTLWRQNPRLERPGKIVSLVHMLRTDPRWDPEAGEGAARIERQYLDSVDAVVCTSEDTRRRIGRLVETSKPAVVAPPAGRHEGSRLDPVDVTARAHEGPLRLAFVGSVVPRKGLHTLLEALGTFEDGKESGDADLDWRLAVLGTLTAEPSYAKRVRERADELEIGDRIEFAGQVPDSDLRAALDRAHVLAVPSRYESFGMAYLEAMEYGVVPIATTVGGPREFITHGEDGLLVSPGDRAALSRAVETLATDRDRLAAMGRAALEASTAHPGWETSMERVRRFLRAVAGDGSLTSFETTATMESANVSGPKGSADVPGSDDEGWSSR